MLQQLVQRATRGVSERCQIYSKSLSLFAGVRQVCGLSSRFVVRPTGSVGAASAPPATHARMTHPRMSLVRRWRLAWVCFGNHSVIVSSYLVRCCRAGVALVLGLKQKGGKVDMCSVRPRWPSTFCTARYRDETARKRTSEASSVVARPPTHVLYCLLPRRNRAQKDTRGRLCSSQPCSAPRKGAHSW